MRRIGLTLLVCAAAVAFTAPATAQEAFDMEALAERWAAAYNAGDDAAIAAMYRDDGCRMPPNAEAVEGREAIVGQLAAGRAQGAAQLRIEVASTATSGDLAYGMGSYRVLGPEGNEIDRGKWMNVVERSGDEWLLVCDIFNSDLPLPTGAAPPAE